MSHRVHRLTTAGTYDEIHIGLREHPDGTADITIRYCMHTQVVLEDHQEVLDVTKVTSWKSDWDPDKHTLEEHFLTRWVSANNKPAGALQMAAKS